MEAEYAECTVAQAKLQNGFNEAVSVQEAAGIIRCWIGEEERRLGKFTFATEEPQIPAGGEVSATVRIDIDPVLPPGTAILDVRVRYQRYVGGRWQPPEGPIVLKDVGSLIVRQRVRITGQVFISFKDPEDLELATQLKEFLLRVGINGYVASLDLRLGGRIWDEKIKAELEKSRGLVVLWTRNTQLAPSNVEREMGMARELGIPIFLARERDVPLPAGFPEQEEYCPLVRATLEADLSSFARGVFIRL